MLSAQPHEDRTDLLGYSEPELEGLMRDRDLPVFHGRQIFRWMYQRRERDILRMSDLSQGLRERLAEAYCVGRLTMTDRSKSSDGSEKYLFTLDEKTHIETVLIPDRNTTTICVSSQAGCPLACAFCATGQMQLKRNLTAGEIVLQALHLRDMFGDQAFSNIVFMGMGEPLLNYEELVKALTILTHPNGLGLSPRRITVSTAGVTPKIKKLAELGLNVNLALSLHAATQEKREQIMPVAKTFALDKLIDAVRDYSSAINRKVTFEYVLLDGFNDTPDDARNLADLARRANAKINLLFYNPVPNAPFVRPTPEKMDTFAKALDSRGALVTVRTSRGRDIDAACGQLAAKRDRAAYATLI